MRLNLGVLVATSLIPFHLDSLPSEIKSETLIISQQRKIETCSNQFPHLCLNGRWGTDITGELISVLRGEEL